LSDQMQQYQPLAVFLHDFLAVLSSLTL